MTDRWNRPDSKGAKLAKSAEEEKADRYSCLAQEALAGARFDALSDEDRQEATKSTIYLIDYIISRVGGKFRRSSPDVLWSTLEQSLRSMSKNEKEKSTFGRFRVIMDQGSRVIFDRLYAMLEAGVDTVAQLQAPKDSLIGLRSTTNAVRSGESSPLLPLRSEVADLSKLK